MPDRATPTATVLERRFVLRGLAAGSLALALPARAAPGDTRFFRIGTGAASGTYFPIGGELASAISDPPGSRTCDKGGSCGVPGVIAVAQATQGSVENVEAVAAGTLESALCQADVAGWAYAGTNLFDHKPARIELRALGNLYLESMHAVVRADSGIAALHELKGRKVSLGEPESGTLVDARLMLGTVGLGEHSIKGSLVKLSAATAGLRDGSLAGFFQIAGYPVPAIAELAADLPIRLLPVPAQSVDRLHKRDPLFVADTIAAGSYPGVDQPVATFGIGGLWIASTRLDDDFAYALVKTLWNANTRRLLDEGHPVGRRITLDHAVDGLSLPLHAGAERYYREVGLLPRPAGSQPG